jgi:hypothetical protein
MAVAGCLSFAESIHARRIAKALQVASFFANANGELVFSADNTGVVASAQQWV